MSYYEQEVVQIYERKFTLDVLNRMYQEGRLHFPQSEQFFDYSITAASLIKAIQLGIPMPVIYASELQNGDFLILESKDQLISLLEYLNGNFSVYLEETFPNQENYFFFELNQKNPRLASMILRTIFLFQIIDYHTPQYLHMEIGLFHEEWDSAREQAIRNILYTGHGIENLHAVHYELFQLSRYFPWVGKSLRIYEILYTLLFWGIYKRKLPLPPQMIKPGEQLLLEITIQNLCNWRYDWADFINIWNSFIAYYAAQPIFTNENTEWHNPLYTNEKLKAKILGLSLCLFDMSIRKGKEPSISLDFFLKSNNYTTQIDTLQISSNSIYSYLNFLWEDNRL